MALVDRLAGIGDAEKLPVHQFWAALYEISKGRATIQQVKNYFNLTGQDATDLDWLAGEYAASTDKPEFVRAIHSFFILAEGGAPGYTTRAELVTKIQSLD